VSLEHLLLSRSLSTLENGSSQCLDCLVCAELVQGSGCRLQGPGFRVQGAGFRFQGSRFRFQVSGFRDQGPGFRVQGSGCRFQGLDFSTASESQGGRAARDAIAALIRQSRPDSGLGLSNFQVKVY